MQLLLWALLALPVAARELARSMQKVVAALENMEAKSNEEMQEEKIEFAKFDEFCKHTLNDKELGIKKTTELLETIEAEISKLDTEVARLTGEIADHEAAVVNAQNQQANATELRKAEAEDFASRRTSLKESLEAIDKAIDHLKPKKSGFVQLDQKAFELAPDELAEISKALSLARALDKPTPPEPDAYNFQSGRVIETLEGLRDQFVKQSAKADASEAKKKHSHEMLLSNLENEINLQEKAKEQKSKFKSSAVSRKAEAEAQKSDLSKDLEGDQKSQSDLSAECKVKGSDFQERQRLRRGEIAAIGKALEILSPKPWSSSLLQSGRNGRRTVQWTVQRLQANGAVSLASLRSVAVAPPVAEVMQFLEQRASELHSAALQSLLVSLQEPSAVEQIAQVVKTKIEKLQTDDLVDPKQKLWCDQELAENGKARESKSDTLQSLKAEIERLESSLVSLAEENEALAADVTKLDTNIKEASEFRRSEKAENLKSLTEASESKEALNAAIEVLEEFYSNLSLLQVASLNSKSAKPEFEAGSYSDGGRSSVIKLLQELETDFTQEVSNLQATEQAAADEFKQFLSDATSDKARKSSTQQHNTMSIASQKRLLEQRKKDLESTDQQLSAASLYHEELNSKCLASDTKFADARKHRDEEIESLQHAYHILNA